MSSASRIDTNTCNVRCKMRAAILPASVVDFCLCVFSKFARKFFDRKFCDALLQSCATEWGEGVGLLLWIDMYQSSSRSSHQIRFLFDQEKFCHSYHQLYIKNKDHIVSVNEWIRIHAMDYFFSRTDFGRVIHTEISLISCYIINVARWSRYLQFLFEKPVTCSRVGRARHFISITKDSGSNFELYFRLIIYDWISWVINIMKYRFFEHTYAYHWYFRMTWFICSCISVQSVLKFMFEKPVAQSRVEQARLTTTY